MYGIEFKNEVAMSFLTPIKLARPDWEACALVTNRLFLNQSTGRYTIQDFQGGSLPATAMNDPLDCPGERSFWDKLGDFFSNFGSWVGDLFGGIGGGGGNSGQAPAAAVGLVAQAAATMAQAAAAGMVVAPMVGAMD